MSVSACQTVGATSVFLQLRGAEQSAVGSAVIILLFLLAISLLVVEVMLSGGVAATCEWH